MIEVKVVASIAVTVPIGSHHQREEGWGPLPVFFAPVLLCVLSVSAS